MKGLSALITESQRAADAAGLGDWFWKHLVETVTDADEEFVVRLLRGAAQHGVRRVHEMEAATAMLDPLTVPQRHDPRHRRHPRHGDPQRPPTQPSHYVRPVPAPAPAPARRRARRHVDPRGLAAPKGGPPIRARWSWASEAARWKGRRGTVAPSVLGAVGDPLWPTGWVR
ncbi:DUF1932 domain-containing protein [Nonomuraea sp. NPDC052634]|uniref:DUF1932 domain-containing protein n=1 Tax=Nonomuraea sp. NPDC052634 TaxID=3155813 RepID=UPI003414FA7D